MKTFTITEEQVKELSKWKHGKRLMQDWFPEAFEKQLEVGKVYKYPSPCIVTGKQIGRAHV